MTTVSNGSEVSTHLTREQIERYVARSGDVDELLAVAEHLEECFDCRDTAAALADPGDESMPARSHPKAPRRR
jgi:predicted anti-sigma-YlaC factor YlaD